MKSRTAVFAGVLLLAGLPLFAAQQAYLKIQGVKGGATDPAHAGWIELTSVSWGVAQGSSATGAGSQHAMHEFTVVKRVDGASPFFFQHAATGAHIQSVTVDMGSVQHQMQGVMVKSVQQTQNYEHPGEAITFVYEKDAIEYGGGTSKPGARDHLPEVALKVEPNATLTLGGAPGAIILQDVRFIGPNQAVLTLRDEGMLVPAVRQFLQTRKPLTEVRIASAGQASGKRMYKPVSFVFHNATVSGYTPAGIGGWDHLTINFANTDGARVAFHDDSVQ